MSGGRGRAFAAAVEEASQAFAAVVVDAGVFKRAAHAGEFGEGVASGEEARAVEPVEHAREAQLAGRERRVERGVLRTGKNEGARRRFGSSAGRCEPAAGGSRPAAGRSEGAVPPVGIGGEAGRKGRTADRNRAAAGRNRRAAG